MGSDKETLSTPPGELQEEISSTVNVMSNTGEGNGTGVVSTTQASYPYIPPRVDDERYQAAIPERQDLISDFTTKETLRKQWLVYSSSSWENPEVQELLERVRVAIPSKHFLPYDGGNFSGHPADSLTLEYAHALDNRLDAAWMRLLPDLTQGKEEPFARVNVGFVDRLPTNSAYVEFKERVMRNQQGRPRLGHQTAPTAIRNMFHSMLYEGKAEEEEQPITHSTVDSYSSDTEELTQQSTSSASVRSSSRTMAQGKLDARKKWQNIVVHANKLLNSKGRASLEEAQNLLNEANNMPMSFLTAFTSSGSSAQATEDYATIESIRSTLGDLIKRVAKSREWRAKLLDTIFRYSLNGIILESNKYVEVIKLFDLEKLLTAGEGLEIRALQEENGLRYSLQLIGDACALVRSTLLSFQFSPLIQTSSTLPLPLAEDLKYLLRKDQLKINIGHHEVYNPSTIEASLCSQLHLALPIRPIEDDVVILLPLQHFYELTHHDAPRSDDLPLNCTDTLAKTLNFDIRGLKNKASLDQIQTLLSVAGKTPLRLNELIYFRQVYHAALLLEERLRYVIIAFHRDRKGSSARRLGTNSTSSNVSGAANSNTGIANESLSGKLSWHRVCQLAKSMERFPVYLPATDAFVDALRDVFEWRAEVARLAEMTRQVGESGTILPPPPMPLSMESRRGGRSSSVSRRGRQLSTPEPTSTTGGTEKLSAVPIKCVEALLAEGDRLPFYFRDELTVLREKQEVARSLIEKLRRPFQTVRVLGRRAAASSSNEGTDNTTDGKLSLISMKQMVADGETLYAGMGSSSAGGGASRGVYRDLDRAATVVECAEEWVQRVRSLVDSHFEVENAHTQAVANRFVRALRVPKQGPTTSTATDPQTATINLGEVAHNDDNLSSSTDLSTTPSNLIATSQDFAAVSDALACPSVGLSSDALAEPDGLSVGVSLTPLVDTSHDQFLDVYHHAEQHVPHIVSGAGDVSNTIVDDSLSLSEIVVPSHSTIPSGEETLAALAAVEAADASADDGMSVTDGNIDTRGVGYVSSSVFGTVDLMGSAIGCLSADVSLDDLSLASASSVCSQIPNEGGDATAQSELSNTVDPQNLAEEKPIAVAESPDHPVSESEFVASRQELLTLLENLIAEADGMPVVLDETEALRDLYALLDWAVRARSILFSAGVSKMDLAHFLADSEENSRALLDSNPSFTSLVELAYQLDGSEMPSGSYAVVRPRLAEVVALRNEYTRIRTKLNEAIPQSSEWVSSSTFPEERVCVELAERAEEYLTRMKRVLSAREVRAGTTLELVTELLHEGLSLPISFESESKPLRIAFATIHEWLDEHRDVLSALGVLSDDPLKDEKTINLAAVATEGLRGRIQLEDVHAGMDRLHSEDSAVPSPPISSTESVPSAEDTQMNIEADTTSVKPEIGFDEIQSLERSASGLVLTCATLSNLTARSKACTNWYSTYERLRRQLGLFMKCVGENRGIDYSTLPILRELPSPLASSRHRKGNVSSDEPQSSVEVNQQVIQELIFSGRKVGIHLPEGEVLGDSVEKLLADWETDTSDALQNEVFPSVNDAIVGLKSLLVSHPDALGLPFLVALLRTVPTEDYFPVAETPKTVTDTVVVKSDEVASSDLSVSADIASAEPTSEAIPTDGAMDVKVVIKAESKLSNDDARRQARLHITSLYNAATTLNSFISEFSLISFTSKTTRTIRISAALLDTLLQTVSVMGVVPSVSTKNVTTGSAGWASMNPQRVFEIIAILKQLWTILQPLSEDVEITDMSKQLTNVTADTPILLSEDLLNNTALKYCGEVLPTNVSLLWKSLFQIPNVDVPTQVPDDSNIVMEETPIILKEEAVDAMDTDGVSTMEGESAMDIASTSVAPSESRKRNRRAVSHDDNFETQSPVPVTTGRGRRASSKAAASMGENYLSSTSAAIIDDTPTGPPSKKKKGSATVATKTTPPSEPPLVVLPIATILAHIQETAVDLRHVFAPFIELVLQLTVAWYSRLEEAATFRVAAQATLSAISSGNALQITSTTQSSRKKSNLQSAPSLLETATSRGLECDEMRQLQAAIQASLDWCFKAKVIVALANERAVLHADKAKQLPSLDDLRDFIKEGEVVCVQHTEELSTLRAELKRARQWKTLVDQLLAVGIPTSSTGSSTHNNNDELSVDDLLTEAETLCVNVAEDLDSLSAATKRYCLCRQLYFGEMIGCDTCEDWFHFHCIGMSGTQAQKCEKYVCIRCQIRTSYKMTCIAAAERVNRWANPNEITKLREANISKAQKRLAKHLAELEKIRKAHAESLLLASVAEAVQNSGLPGGDPSVAAAVMAAATGIVPGIPPITVTPEMQSEALDAANRSSAEVTAAQEIAEFEKHHQGSLLLWLGYVQRLFWPANYNERILCELAGPLTPARPVLYDDIVTQIREQYAIHNSTNVSTDVNLSGTDLPSQSSSSTIQPSSEPPTIDASLHNVASETLPSSPIPYDRRAYLDSLPVLAHNYSCLLPPIIYQMVLRAFELQIYSHEDIFSIIEAFKWCSWCSLTLHLLRYPASTSLLKIAIDSAKSIRCADDKLVKFLGMISNKSLAWKQKVKKTLKSKKLDEQKLRSLVLDGNNLPFTSRLKRKLADTLGNLVSSSATSTSSSSNGKNSAISALLEENFDDGSDDEGEITGESHAVNPTSKDQVALSLARFTKLRNSYPEELEATFLAAEPILHFPVELDFPVRRIDHQPAVEPSEGQVLPQVSGQAPFH